MASNCEGYREDITWGVEFEGRAEARPSISPALPTGKLMSPTRALSAEHHWYRHR